MMVPNHFDVRWVDGYSAVSDVPSSLAATIEKLAAELPSSGDRIELAVRDVRKPDGTLLWVGLLRFVVAVSSAPRQLGFLHAAVLPGGYRVDLDGWRALVQRRYGPFPEERIRTLYEELAESTKDSGRDRLHALAIRPEDVRELLTPLEEGEVPAGLPRAHARPGSRPPRNGYVRPASSPGIAPAPAGPRIRPSQSSLPISMQVVNLPHPAPEPEGALDLRLETDLPNDVTQPMEAPTAAPISGEHPQHRLVEERGQRVWWTVPAVVGALAVLLAALGWLGHRHVVLVSERDRLVNELSRRNPDRDAWERTRAELETVKRELEERKQADLACQRRIEAETKTCTDALGKARDDSRANADSAAKYREEAQLRANELSAANSKLMSLKNDLSVMTQSRESTEQLYREEHQRATDRDAEAKRAQITLNQQAERLRLLCRSLQSGSGSYRPPPKECQGIK
jgi:DNA repair exonuclease SbcCD ATPase subunit